MSIILNSQDSNFSSIDAVSIFVAFFAVLVVITFIKKLFYYIKFKKRYYVFPRPSIQGIANIAMVTALSVAVLLLLTFITSNLFSVMFRAFPGSRVTIEGILIKIGGLLFGPFIGMFVGALTDLLSIIMTAGIFHYGYFIAAIGYGLCAGLVKSIFSYSKRNNFVFAVVATIVMSAIACAAVGFTYLYVDPNGFNQSVIPITILQSISRSTIVYIFLGFSTVVLLVIWFSFFFSKMLQERKMRLSQNQRHFNSKQIKQIDKNYFINFTLVLMCATVSEMVINVLMMPAFDASLSTLRYGDWFTIRILLFFPMILFNFVIIYPVYTIVWPLVKWDYKKELVEDYNVPLYIK